MAFPGPTLAVVEFEAAEAKAPAKSARKSAAGLQKKVGGKATAPSAAAARRRDVEVEEQWRSEEQELRGGL
jgi:hypothetical protein